MNTQLRGKMRNLCDRGDPRASVQYLSSLSVLSFWWRKWLPVFMAGKTLAELGFTKEIIPSTTA